MINGSVIGLTGDLLTVKDQAGRITRCRLVVENGVLRAVPALPRPGDQLSAQPPLTDDPYDAG